MQSSTQMYIYVYAIYMYIHVLIYIYSYLSVEFAGVHTNGFEPGGQRFVCRQVTDLFV